MSWLSTKEKRSFAIQLSMAAILVVVSYIIVQNIRENLADVGIRLGFGFLDGEAGFDVNESLISYAATDSYRRVLLVGFLNTLELSILNIADWFGNRKMDYKVENIGDKSARIQAFYAGKCDVLASDYTALLSDRQLAPNPGNYTILPDIISNEPLTLVSQPDQELESILFWGFQVMLTAEQHGLNSKNIDTRLKRSCQPAKSG